MPKSRTNPSFAFAFALVATALIGGQRQAMASHYALGDVPTLVSAAEVDKLRAANISTTAELLGRAAKTKDRKALAKATGLSASALLDLARRCDVLRIKGVGPEMVLLLEASGVRAVADLAKADPAAIASRASTANQAKKISQKPPTEAQFEHWIGEAKKLPAVLETK